MKLGYLFILMLCTNLVYAFDMTRYRAHKAYQANNFSDAQCMYEQRLIDQPDDAQTNFDMGNVFYRMQKFDQAKNYFQRAAESEQASLELAQQARFNCANSYVQLHRLPEAIEQYEAVLKIDSEHERAKHNLEIVRKMLENEQRDQQQKKKQQDKENNQQEKDQQKKENASERQPKNQEESNQDAQENKNDSKTNSAKNNGPEHDQSDSSRSKQEKNSEEKQNSQDKLNSEISQEKGKQGGGNKQTGKQDQNFDREGHSSSDSTSDNQQKEEDAENSPEHDAPIEKKEQNRSNIQDNVHGVKAQEDAQVQALLQWVDEADKQVNKQLLKMQIKKGMAKRDGQKNW